MEHDGDQSSPPHPQLTAVVIVTLPPPDNPSLGKTITAFTLSDQPPVPATPQPESAHQEPSIPPQAQLAPHHHDRSRDNPYSSSSSSRTFIHIPPIIILPVLSIAVVALYVWASFSQENLFQLQDEVWNDDDDPRNNSHGVFLFPLYRKTYSMLNSEFGDSEFKLRRVMSFSSGSTSKGFGNTKSRGNSNNNIAKLRSTASKIHATAVMPVGGNIYPDGLYYTYIHVGNPPRPYFLDMDTGSGLTWIQCDAPCTSCAKGPHPLYKPVKANIIPSRDSYCTEIQRNQMVRGCESCHQCDYEIEYADHSSSMGVLARDELYLKSSNGSYVKSKVVFGCAYDQQGVLLNALGKTDGILGLSRAKISLPYQLAGLGIIKNVVGHCLSTDTSGGGYMFLGDDFVPYSKMAWVPMFQSLDSDSYQTELVKVSYGSTQLGFGNNGVRSGQRHLVFDSGSSYSYFTGEAYNSLITQFDGIPSEGIVRDMSDTSFPICWRPVDPSFRSVADVRQFFKPLTLHFQSKWWIPIKLHIPPEGYLVTNSKGNVCLGILNGSKISGGSVSILGDISLRGLLIVYDNTKEQIGWIQSNCVRPRRLNGYSMS